MKKIKILIIMLIPFLMSSCGYQPIFLKKDINLNVLSIKKIGNQKINTTIIKNIEILNNSNKSGKKINVEISSQDSNETISKDKKGVATKFLMSLNINIKIYDQENLLKEKSFNKEFVYNNSENKFDLNQYKKQIQSNLLNKIIEEISIFFYNI
tara:strand:+ start:308 stop:769 length:462 start_codon:yes stop_codon:yes gene_type:complete